MYEGDTPNAERRAAALSLDRDLLRELLGQEELRDLIDPGALAQVEDDLQFLSELRRGDRPRRAARRAADARRPDAQRERGCACVEGLDAGSMLAELQRERRAVAGAARAARSAGSTPPTPGLYRDALGVGAARRTAGGVPRGRARRAARGWSGATPRPTARSRPPTCGRATASTAPPSLAELERAGELVRGELRPGGSEREWCDPEVLRRLRRASLAVLRKEVEPVDQRALARFLPAWQNVDRHPRVGRRRSTACARRSSRCRRWRCRPRCGSATCSRGALGAYSPTWMDQLCAGGELVWIGAGALGRHSGRVALYFREDLPLLGPPPCKGDRATGRRKRTSSSVRVWPPAPASSRDLLVDVELAPEELQEALWDLAWAGEVDERRVRAAARAAADAGPRPARPRARSAGAPVASPRAGAARAPRRRSRAAGR